MRVGVVLVGIISFFASMYAAVWLINSGKLPTNAAEKLVSPDEPAIQSAAERAKEAESKSENSERPAINREPGAPQPKAVIEETEFKFGKMDVGEEGEHTFVIRNEGEAPLIVVKGPTTCQCTVGSVSHKEVAPGESTEVKLTWKPTAPSDEFNKGADIWTNDPDRDTIKLTLVGFVGTRLNLYPGHVWQTAGQREDGSILFSGTISSAIEEQFAITGFDCSNESVSAEAKKIEDPKRLKALEARSGFEVEVTVKPDINVGGFAVPLTIKTDLLGKSGAPLEVPVTIRGSRRGPIKILGPEWVPEYGAISMGQFDVNVGKSVTLKVVVLHPPAEGFQVNEADIVCDPKELRVRLVPDEMVKKGPAGRFLLTVEYPAGAPRIIRYNEDAGKIKMRTNHPQSSEIEFPVYFAAH